MADDLTLEVVIKALLDSKGFAEAQGQIKGFAAAANAAKAPAREASDSGKKMGESFGGSRGPVADLTRVLLINIGATRGVGEAAKFAGAGLHALEAGAAGATLPLVGMIAVLSLGLPKLIEWVAASGNETDELKALRDQLVDLLPELEEYASKVKNLTEAQQAQLTAARALALDKERDRLAKLIADSAKHEAELRDATVRVAALDATIAKNFGSLVNAPAALRQEFERMTGVEATTRDALRQEKAQIDELKAALLQNKTVQQLRTEEVEKAASADKKLGEALDYELEALQRQAQAVLDAKGAIIDFNEQQEKDAERDIRKQTAKDDKKKEKADKEEIQRILDYQDVQQDAMLLDKQGADAKKINALNAVGYAGQAFTALSSLFGQNKALAIAGAIADTYAAANLALKTIPPPAGYAAAAASVAVGLANVQSIRKATPIGFDDPFSDLVARQFGRRSAADFAKHFGGEFTANLPAAMVNQYHSRTTINRGTNIDLRGQTINGVIGNKMAVARAQERQLRRAERFRRRTTVGRP